jgi:hypothetical protein
VMGFEFGFGSGCRLEGGDIAGLSNLSFEFGDKGLRNRPFFRGGCPCHSAVNILENPCSHFGGIGHIAKLRKKNQKTYC